MATNMFKVKKNPRYLNYSVSAADLDQDVKDWLRDGSADGLLIVNGSDFSDLVKVDKASFPDQEVTASSLFKLWEKEILNKMHSNGLYLHDRYELYHFMQKYFHQGAFLHMMQTALCEAAINNGYAIAGSNVVSHINIFVKDNALIIQEDTKVKKLYSKDDPEIEIKSDNGNPYVIVGSITHRVTFDENNTLCHQISNCEVIYSNKKVENIIDHRSLLRKVIDAFLDLFAMEIRVNNLSL